MSEADGDPRDGPTDAEGRRVKRLTPTYSQRAPAQLVWDVYDALKSEGVARPTELADHLDVTPHRIHSALGSLKKHGLIERRTYVPDPRQTEYRLASPLPDPEGRWNFVDPDDDGED